MEDFEIVNLYWERKENAIEETKKKYEHRIIYVIGNILSDSCDIEECVNDTYLGAWNAMPDARPTYLSAFLCRIAKNLALKKVEYLTAEKRNKNIVTALDELDKIIDAQDIEQEIIAKQTAEAINTFLKKKKSLHRKIFVRRYYFYDTIEEIASQFFISRSAVKSILFRMRKDLKKYLQE